jgi:hypothetical protein
MKEHNPGKPICPATADQKQDEQEGNQKVEHVFTHWKED